MGNKNDYMAYTEIIITPQFFLVLISALRCRQPDGFKSAAMDAPGIDCSGNRMALSWQPCMLLASDAKEPENFEFASMDATRIGCSRKQFV